jgi:phosphodiesterase/alkaline phosphatase D-like protein
MAPKRDLSITAFKCALGFSDESPPLVQLGLPGQHHLVVWCVPKYGDAKLEVDVVGPSGSSWRCDVSGDNAAARVVIRDRQPGTEYAFTMMVNGKPFQVQASTAPSEGSGASFSFVAFSCLAPFSPGAKRFEKSFQLLRGLEALACPSESKPSFCLGMGDQVYVDDGAVPLPADWSLLSGFGSQHLRYAGSAAEFFEVLYRAHFSYPGFARALSALPSAMMWDDHEIRDGWGSHGDEANLLTRPEWREHTRNARLWFQRYQGLRNPRGYSTPENAQEQPLGTLGNELDFAFDWGGRTTFFTLDLRSQRTPTQAMSDTQLASVERWLRRGGERHGRLFVLVSPIPVSLPVWPSWDPGRWLPFRGDDVADQWWSAGLRRQGERLRGALAAHFTEHQHDRLLILSGDVHYSEARQLIAGSRSIGHEIVSSGLAQGSFFKSLAWIRGIEERGPQFADNTIVSRSLGRYHGPSFVQLFVDPQADRAAPRVHVRFHHGRDDSQARNLIRNAPWELSLP